MGEHIASIGKVGEEKKKKDFESPETLHFREVHGASVDGTIQSCNVTFQIQTKHTRKNKT